MSAHGAEPSGGLKSAAAAAPAEFVYAGTELEAMACAPNYYRAIYSWFEPYLGSRVIEVGAGVGTFAEHLASNPAVESLTLLEPAENNFPELRRRFAGDPRVVPIHGFLEDIESQLSADTLVIVNVLEHVDRDIEFLRSARRVLEPGGRLLIFVPALQGIFGSLDEAFDHYRRYSREQLSAKLREAGFNIRLIRYANLPGALSWYIVGRVLRRRTLSARDVRLYDRWVIPWVVRMERLWSPPFGQSLLVIAETAEP